MGLLEHQSRAGHIDLFYGDSTKVSEQGYVPYGWQFSNEDISIPAHKGKSVNCFGLITRTNKFVGKVTENNINADFMIELLDDLSLQITKTTVVVLDNARAHTARKVKERLEYWRRRGLYIFYLPPYSPQLNIIERLWKELKEGWLKPSDYISADQLFYAVNRICANIGNSLKMNFSEYKY